jgi:2-oxoglutarate ferredoxin oxidoreductase subunit gamma
MYGPETRGGNSISEVVLSDTEIDYPKPLKLDLFVALTREACVRNLPDMKAEGLVIVDSDQVPKVLWERVASLPLSQMAQKAGDERAINMAALGAVVSLCPRLSSRSLVKVMKKRLPSSKVAVNLLAFEEALKCAGRIKEGLRPVATEPAFEI